MKKILIIAHFCDYGNENSNNRFNYLANLFVEKGYAVELITSSFSHRDKVQRNKEENIKKYRTTLIYEPSYKRNVSIKRLFYSHKIFSINMEKYLKKIIDKPDYIYCAIPSIDSCYAAMQYAKKNGIPFIIDIQDIWPDAYKLIIKNEKFFNIITFFMKTKVDLIYKMSDLIISVSDTYLHRAMEACVSQKKSKVVFLGTDFDKFDQYKSEGKKDDYIKLCYCGTLGFSYDLSIMIEALIVLITEGISNVKLIILGSGPSEKKLREQSKKIEDYVEFLGKKPYYEMVDILTSCDIALNPIKSDAAQSIINKHADYCAAGLPILSTQNCLEYKKLLEEYNCGITCDSKSINDIAEAMKYLIMNKKEREKMGKNSRKLGEDKFNRKYSYMNIIKEIELL